MSVNMKMNSDIKLSNKQTECPKCGHIFSPDFSENSGNDINLNNPAERRIHKRIKKNTFVQLNNKIALLIDISEGGMLLGLKEIPGDHEVDIKLKIQEKSFKLKGVVKWIRDRDSFSGLSSIGIMLIDPPEKYRKLIQSTIEQE